MQPEETTSTVMFSFKSCKTGCGIDLSFSESLGHQTGLVEFPLGLVELTLGLTEFVLLLCATEPPCAIEPNE